MAVPTSILDLSQTEASNSPAGSEVIGGTLDNFIRANEAIAAQEAQNKGWVPQVGAVGAPTFISATSFSVTTDQTSAFFAGRSIKCTITGNVRYGVIVTSAFSSVTTVTVILDGDLDNTLSRVDLGVERRSFQTTENRIINPWFRYWQRNVTFAIGAGLTANTADGVGISNGTSGVVTASRQAHTIGQTVVPFEPTYFFRWDQTTGGTGPLMKHHIENVRTFADQVVTIWFIAKVASGTLSVTPRVTQYFGVGGAPSANVTTTGTAQTVDTNFRLFQATIKVPSIVGKTIGTTAYSDSCRIDLLAPSATIFTLDIAAWGVNAGTMPYIEPPKPDLEELYRCRRRYFKTFNVDVVPAQAAGREGSFAYVCYRAAATASYWTVPLTVPLRIPIASTGVTFYSPIAATSAWYNTTGGAASGASGMGGPGGTTFTTAADRIVIINAQAAADALSDIISVHFSIEAEYAATV